MIPPTTEIYPLSLHDALPIYATQPWFSFIGVYNIQGRGVHVCAAVRRIIGNNVNLIFTWRELRFAVEKYISFPDLDRKSTRLNSSHGYISYAVFCLKKKKI